MNTIRYLVLAVAVVLAGSSWAGIPATADARGAQQSMVQGGASKAGTACTGESVKQRALNLASQQCDGVSVAYLQQARSELGCQAN
jgi:hypothetical protein